MEIAEHGLSQNRWMHMEHNVAIIARLVLMCFACCVNNLLFVVLELLLLFLVSCH